MKKKNIILFCAGIFFCKFFSDKLCRKKDFEIEKKNAYIDMLDRWMTLRDRGIAIERFLSEKGYKKVAIYGLGMFGNHLYEELQGTEIEIIGIDKADIYDNFRMKIYKPDQKFEDVDLIIVTPFEYEKICRSMEMYHGAFISLQQLLNECEEYLYTLYSGEE